MRFAIDLWPDGPEGMTPADFVRCAIESIATNGEHFSWDILNDVDQSIIARNVIPAKQPRHRGPQEAQEMTPPRYHRFFRLDEVRDDEPQFEYRAALRHPDGTYEMFAAGQTDESGPNPEGRAMTDVQAYRGGVDDTVAVLIRRPLGQWEQIDNEPGAAATAVTNPDPASRADVIYVLCAGLQAILAAFAEFDDAEAHQQAMIDGFKKVAARVGLPWNDEFIPEEMREQLGIHLPSKAQKVFDALPDAQKLVIVGKVFQILEYDEEGNPGGEWSSDTTQALGELFNSFGVVFTSPE